MTPNHTPSYKSYAINQVRNTTPNNSRILPVKFLQWYRSVVKEVYTTSPNLGTSLTKFVGTYLELEICFTKFIRHPLNSETTFLVLVWTSTNFVRIKVELVSSQPYLNIPANVSTTVVKNASTDYLDKVDYPAKVLCTRQNIQ